MTANSEKWVNTLPKPKTNESVKKFSVLLTFFILGLIFVSIVKNETRKLQNEIIVLEKTVDSLKLDLHQATLDHEFITSPESLSRLAKDYLETDFVFYTKSQMRDLNNFEKITVMNKVKTKEITNEKNKGFTKKIKIKLAKKIKEKKNNVKKIKEIYARPKELPATLKLQFSKKIQIAKHDLKYFYDHPTELITQQKVQKWGMIQMVKAVLGVPIVPGR